MEKINADLSALLNSARMGTEALSRVPSYEELVERAGWLLDEMRKRRPAMTLTDEFVDTWLDDAVELMRRFSPERFELCLREISLTSAFIPNCGEIGERLQGSAKSVCDTGALEEIEKHKQDLAARGEAGLGMLDLFSDPTVKAIVERGKQTLAARSAANRPTESNSPEASLATEKNANEETSKPGPAETSAPDKSNTENTGAQ